MNNAGTGFEKVVVRRAGDLGVDTDSEPPEIRRPGDYGSGSDLQTPAFDEIRERVDLDEHDAKTHVATIEWLVTDQTQRVVAAKYERTPQVIWNTHDWVKRRLNQHPAGEPA